jgi:hypothetical protein
VTCGVGVEIEKHEIQTGSLKDVQLAVMSGIVANHFAEHASICIDTLADVTESPRTPQKIHQILP